MNTKKILIFSLVYYPRFIGGAEVAIKEITDRIDPSEIEFHMVTLRLDKKLSKYEKIGNVHVHRVGFVGNMTDPADSLKFPLHLNKYLLPFNAVREAQKLQKEIHFDATWSMMANYAGFAALFFKMRNPKIPLLLSLQEGDPIDYIKHRTRFVSPIFKRIFTKADLVQTISNYLGDFAKSMGYRGEVVVVPNAVNTSLFSKKLTETERADLKNKLGKKDGDIFLITTSRLVVKNAVDDIIKSLTHLPNNIKFLILGVGYEEAKLKSLAEKIGVSNRVQFLGYVAHDEMPKYLHVSDIFVRPSLSEGFGNSFVEAMAADIPVIATPIGGIVDFLKDGETGLFCKVKDPQSIAVEVKRLIDDLALRQKIVTTAHAMVFEKYDWNHIAKDMKEKVFDHIKKPILEH
jgi:glycosyltransferase involved in cell wall biosynthesis